MHGLSAPNCEQLSYCQEFVTVKAVKVPPKAQGPPSRRAELAARSSQAREASLTTNKQSHTRWEHRVSGGAYSAGAPRSRRNENPSCGGVRYTARCHLRPRIGV